MRRIHGKHGKALCSPTELEDICPLYFLLTKFESGRKRVWNRKQFLSQLKQSNLPPFFPLNKIDEEQRRKWKVKGREGLSVSTDHIPDDRADGVTDILACSEAIEGERERDPYPIIDSLLSLIRTIAAGGGGDGSSRKDSQKKGAESRLARFVSATVDRVGEGEDGIESVPTAIVARSRGKGRDSQSSQVLAEQKCIWRERESGIRQESSPPRAKQRLEGREEKED